VPQQKPQQGVGSGGGGVVPLQWPTYLSKEPWWAKELPKGQALREVVNQEKNLILNCARVVPHGGLSKEEMMNIVRRYVGRFGDGRGAVMKTTTLEVICKEINGRWDIKFWEGIRTQMQDKENTEKQTELLKRKSTTLDGKSRGAGVLVPSKMAGLFS